MDKHADLRASLDAAVVGDTESIYRFNVACHPGAIRSLLAERDALREALQAAVDCGMVPKSSAKDGGANRYSEQVRVADLIRAALNQQETGK